MAEDREFQERMGRIEGLLQVLEGCADPAVREAARELVGAVLDLHGTALAKLLHLAAASGEPGRDLIDRLGRDELVGSLFVLHGLHPLEPQARVARALEEIRPRLLAEGGDVEVERVAGETARLRWHGGPALRAVVERAVLAAAPELRSVFFDEGGRLPLPLVAEHADTRVS